MQNARDLMHWWTGKATTEWEKWVPDSVYTIKGVGQNAVNQLVLNSDSCKSTKHEQSIQRFEESLLPIDEGMEQIPENGSEKKETEEKHGFQTP